MPEEHPITLVLHRLSSASDEQSQAVSEELLELVHGELHRQARAMMARERPGHTLQATALLNEAYIRVLGGSTPTFERRAHFFAASAEAMRRILINKARRKRQIKHGGEVQREWIAADEIAVESPGDDILAVDEVLQKLEESDPRARQIVNLKFFSGLTTGETAEILGVSTSTVEREWRFIRVWLRNGLMEDEKGEKPDGS